MLCGPMNYPLLTSISVTALPIPLAPPASVYLSCSCKTRPCTYQSERLFGQRKPFRRSPKKLQVYEEIRYKEGLMEPTYCGIPIRTAFNQIRRVVVGLCGESSALRSISPEVANQTESQNTIAESCRQDGRMACVPAYHKTELLPLNH
jgi:hypothetical protein